MNSNETISSGYINHNNVSTYYEIRNQHIDEIPLILLAGGPGLTFNTLTSLFSLSSNRPIVSYDQIGSGLSTRSDSFEQLHLADFIEQFSTLIETLKLDKFHIIGHSWGSILATQIALVHPNRIQKLIIYSGIADWEHCLKSRKLLFKKEFPNGMTGWTNEDIQKYYYCRVPYPDYLERSLAEKDEGTNQMIWNPDINQEMAVYNAVSLLRNIHCPTLIISGKYDGISVGQAELFKEIPYSVHKQMKQSAHYAHVEEEEKFMDTVQAFLSI